MCVRAMRVRTFGQAVGWFWGEVGVGGGWGAAGGGGWWGDWDTDFLHGCATQMSILCATEMCVVT